MSGKKPKEKKGLLLVTIAATTPVEEQSTDIEVRIKIEHPFSGPTYADLFRDSARVFSNGLE